MRRHGAVSVALQGTAVRLRADPLSPLHAAPVGPEQAEQGREAARGAAIGDDVSPRQRGRRPHASGARRRPGGDGQLPAHGAVDGDTAATHRHGPLPG